MRKPHYILMVLLLAVVGIATFFDRPKRSVNFDPVRHKAFKKDWNKRVHITYWEKWSGFERDACQQMVDMFNASQDRIIVHYVNTSGVDEKGLLAVLSGRPPDVIGLWDYNLGPYAQAGALLPLDEFMQANNLPAHRYDPNVLSLCRYKGRTYALPTTPAVVALHYNKDHFKKHAAELRAAGLDPNRAPNSITELDAYAEILDERRPDGSYAVMGFLPTEPGWFNWSWGYHFGGTLLDAAGRSTADAPGNVDAFWWAKRYSLRYGRDAVTGFKSQFGNFDSPQNAFIDGKVSMEMQGVWFPNFVRRYKPGFNLGVAPFPSRDAAGIVRSSVTSDIIAIPSGCLHPEEAKEFLVYAQTKGLVLICRAQGKHMPLRAEEYPKQFYNGHKNQYIKIFVDIAASPDCYVLPPIGVWNEYKQELSTAFDKVWNHDLNEKEFAAATNDEEAWRNYIRKVLGEVNTRIQARMDHEDTMQALHTNPSEKGN